MNRFLFYTSTILVALFVQILFRRYLTMLGISPDVLLLVVVSVGFLLGPLAGESVGFISGLIMDASGTSLFGAQMILFTIIGYACGKLRHHVDSERPAPQVVIAVSATIVYCLGLSAIQSLLEEGRSRLHFFYAVIEVFFNGVFSVVVFWLLERWVSAFHIDSEHA